MILFILKIAGITISNSNEHVALGNLWRRKVKLASELLVRSLRDPLAQAYTTLDLPA